MRSTLWRSEKYRPKHLVRQEAAIEAAVTGEDPRELLKRKAAEKKPWLRKKFPQGPGVNPGAKPAIFSRQDRKRIGNGLVTNRVNYES